VSSTPETAGPAPRAQVVARNSIWMTLDALVGLPVALALSILVARSIGPDVLGVYNFAIWVLSAGMTVVTTGVTFGMQQFAAERLGQGDVAAATAVLRRGLQWQLGLVAAILAAGVAITLGFSPPEFRIALLIAVASTAPAVLVSVPAAGLGAAQAYAQNVLPSIVAALVNLLVSVAALAAGWGLVGLTSALLLSRVVDVTMRVVFWRRVWRGLKSESRGRDAAVAPAVDVDRMRRYAWRSSVLLLIDMIVWDRSEFFVLTRFSSLREVAFYSLSFNVVQQALILPRMFAQGFSANLLVERGRDPESAVRLSRDAMRYVFLLAAPLTLGLAAIDRAIMPMLYGPKYTEAIPVISIVAGLAVMRGALVPVQDLLRMTEQQPFLIRFSAVMAVVSIALDLWLIPSGGAVGAAWANGIAQALAMAGLTTFASRRLGLSVPLGDMGRTLLACLPMVVVVRALAEWLHHGPAVLLGVPLGAVIYMSALRVLRVLRPVDLDRLLSLERTLPVAVRPAYQRGLRWVVASGAHP
jgi:O-antigen/teichoic acid export membrane protein